MPLVISFLFLIAILGVSTGYGMWFTKNQGRIREGSSAIVTGINWDFPLGERLTLVQFSSAFCMPCKTTRQILNRISEEFNDVAHIEIDAESNLDLVRKLNILSTPTTVILDSQGNERGRAVGAPTREQVLNAIAPITI